MPQGGRTGFVGAAVPVHDEIIIKMDRMNKIIGFEKSYGVLQCEAGVVLKDA